MAYRKHVEEPKKIISKREVGKIICFEDKRIRVRLSETRYERALCMRRGEQEKRVRQPSEERPRPRSHMQKRELARPGTVCSRGTGTKTRGAVKQRERGASGVAAHWGTAKQNRNRAAEDKEESPEPDTQGRGKRICGLRQSKKRKQSMI